MSRDFPFYYEAGKDIRDDILPHGHDFSEFFLITEGRCEHLVNGASQVLEEGELIFIRADDVHAYRPIEGELCTYVNLAFRHEVLAAMTKLLGGNTMEDLHKGESPPRAMLGKTDIIRVRSTGDDLYSVRGEDPDRGRAHLTALLTSFFRAMIWHDDERPIWFAKMLQAMQKEENIRLGLPAMRRVSGVSNSQMSRILREKMDLNPSEFVRQARVRLAQRYLQTTDMPITDIAYQVGFDNLSYFNRSFRLVTGMTPSRWRQLQGQSLL